jgi:dTDP-4-amino-4,6-dideoxygalactose transaminase
VAALEREVAAMLDGAPVAAVSSGGAALLVAFKALALGPGDEVVVPAFAFPAAAQAAAWLGALPVAADVDPETFAATPETVAAVLTPATRAVVLVHAFGIPGDAEALSASCLDYGLFLVEDAACSLGGRTLSGRPSGTVGTLGCYSLHPRKVATTGEGGLVTGSPDMLDRVRSLRDYGRTGVGPGDIFSDVGLNFRMSDLAASIGRVQAGRITASRNGRATLVARYIDGLSGLPGVQIPAGWDLPGQTWQSFVVRILGDANGAREAMNREGIGAGVAAHALTDQGFYRRIAPRDTPCPVAETLARECLALPLFDEMSIDQVDQVVSSLKNIVRRVR